MSSFLLKVGEMENNTEDCCNSIKSQGSNSINIFSNAENNFLKIKSCKNINEDIFFKKDYEYNRLIKSYNNETLKFVFDHDFSKRIFHNMVVFDCNKNSSNFVNLEKIDSLIDIANEELPYKDKYEYSFYRHKKKTHRDGQKVPDSENNSYFNHQYEDFENDVNIENFKVKLRSKIKDLYEKMTHSDYYTSKKLFDIAVIEKYDNDHLIYYYLLFESINYMINFFQSNFPNICKRYREFIDNNKCIIDDNSNIKLRDFSFIFKNNDEFDNIKNDMEIGGKTNVYYKDENNENVPFTISFNIKKYVRDLKNSDTRSYLNIVKTVVHEMLHFITNSFTYDIIKKCEIGGKLKKNKELCFLFYMRKINLTMKRK